MRRPLAILLAALVAAGVTWHVPRAWACSCEARTTARELRAADSVFVGVVAALEQTDDGPITATVAVSAVYEGDLRELQTVRTPATAEACGVGFVPGMRYTVFGTLRMGDLWADSCSTVTGDEVLSDHEPIVRFELDQALGGTVTVPPDPAAAPAGRAGLIAAAILVLVAAVLGNAVAMRSRRARAGLPGPPSD